MTVKRRLTALECAHQKQQALNRPDLAAMRRYFKAMHKAYGPPGMPAPSLLDSELMAWDAELTGKLNSGGL